MAEHMQFLPRKEVLSLEELYRLATVFIDNGVRKIRITGGEPLVRKNIMSLFQSLSPHLERGDIDEVTLTTNGTQLSRYAHELADLGVERVNVSLDTLDPERFRQITRLGNVEQVLEGIDAALSAKLKVKLNVVAARGAFEDEVDDLIEFAHRRQMDLTFIEEMPLGAVAGDRTQTSLHLSDLRTSLETRWNLSDLSDSTGGPARYVQVGETGGRLGFITPLSCNFCTLCNRLRVDCTGRLFTCMGDEGSVDLRETLRGSNGNEVLEHLIRETVFAKPKGHSFELSTRKEAGISRYMSTLGG